MVRYGLAVLSLVFAVSCGGSSQSDPNSPSGSSSNSGNPHHKAKIKYDPMPPGPKLAPGPNPLASAKFVPDPTGQVATRWNYLKDHTKTDDDKKVVAALKVIKDLPGAKWMGDWNKQIKLAVQDYVEKLSASGGTPVMISYNIPNRDCGQYSSGGSKDPEAYRRWVHEFADGITTGHPVVILEPDAMPQLDMCLSPADQEVRLGLYLDAVRILKAKGAIVYLDAGHCSWQKADVMADRLKKAGIDEADGFSLNTSNYQTTECNTEYGHKVSALVGGKHFVIDTSRNGNGPTADNQWCNPPGRALGVPPTTDTKDPLIDAFLWAKVPGESDGDCGRGDPAAGNVFDKQALDLVQNSKWASAAMGK